uniref:Uncharacterized protein n=1 Tax=Mus musculus TaxID=10090 RepID=Q3UW79_MOUSE|nr:unnamed protein product [Mus musculus]
MVNCCIESDSWATLLPAGPSFTKSAQSLSKDSREWLDRPWISYPKFFGHIIFFEPCHNVRIGNCDATPQEDCAPALRATSPGLLACPLYRVVTCDLCSGDSSPDTACL